MTCETRTWYGPVSGLWFFGCQTCSWFEGGYPTGKEAEEGRLRHVAKAEARRDRRAQAREAEQAPRITAGLLPVPRARGT